MKQFFSKPYRWAIIYSFFLISGTVFLVLDSFYLPSVQKTVTAQAQETVSTSEESNGQSESAIVTDTSYESDDLSIQIKEERIDETTVHIVDIKTSDSSHLLTALADDSYGRNIKGKTSEMAENNQAILAINGDYYGFRNTGYVLRNGVSYRDTANGDTDALVIDKNGDFQVINESEVALSSVAETAQQVLSFGPALVEDGEITVESGEEVSQSMTSNPRTAIGQIGENHYVIIVSEGRTDESVGLSLVQLAEVFESLGAKTAYNLDGGGSSTLYFNGQVVNQIVGGRSQSEERSVSDILYFK